MKLYAGFIPFFGAKWNTLGIGISNKPFLDISSILHIAVSNYIGGRSDFCTILSNEIYILVIVICVSEQHKRKQ